VRREALKKKSSWFFCAVLAAHFLAGPLLFAEQPPDIEEQTRAIAAELRCPVCQNLSVADSPSELAQQMSALVQDQLKEGKSPEEIKKFFVSKYGDWVLLAPPKKGFSLLLWVLPYTAAFLGLVFVVFVTRRWVRRKHELTPAAAAGTPETGQSQRDFLLGEQARLDAELKEIEFDFQAGKLSESDYDGLRRNLKAQAAAVGKRLDATPAVPPRSATVRAPEKKDSAAGARPTKRWQLAAGGLFLLLFGLTLGVLLTKSLRPRGSEQDSITGDFLTGTPSGGGADALLAQGRAAFEQGNWSQAIETFKKVLASDPNQAEAHAYMGLILAQAGHLDGALTAFDRALAAAPNLPMALWGKGMVLYQTGGDPAEARRLLQKVSGLMQPGPEKEEVDKTIAQMAQRGNAKTPASKPAPPSAQSAPAGGEKIEGVVDVDPKLKGKIDAQAVLFIIARSASGAGGPPLAVKRIASPKFPVAYSLSAQDVMMQGTPFSGKVFLSARLDKDGNAATRDPGDLAGEYKKNPVEVGAKKIDIVLEAAR
jgi:cytochrome c-type biogenesis protein CcmH